MSNNTKQTAFQKYGALLRFHGLAKGSRRAFDQFFQIDIYDWIHGTNTGQIMPVDEYFSELSSISDTAAMHYQPVYTAAVKQPLEYLRKNHPDVGASSACFLDLGCGRGKSLHVAKSTLSAASLLGIELHPILVEDAWTNLGFSKQADIAETIRTDHVLAARKHRLVLQDVNDVDYKNLLATYDVVIVFNKNSFDKFTTKNTLEKIQEAMYGKSLYYIYNNPVFGDLFEKFPYLYGMSGWHKNWNTKVFRIPVQTGE